MGTQEKRKSTRFSRWRERRRAKAQRAWEIESRLRAPRSGHNRGDNRGSGDSGSLGGGVGGAGI
jgi:hypothetical protein